MKKTIFYAMLLLVVLLGVPENSSAEYIGPKRTYTTTEKETCDVGVWARSGGGCWANGIPRDCTICSWECSPGSACGDADYWYTTGTTTIKHKVTRTHPPATVSGSLSCDQPGNNGWCLGGAVLELSAAEPLSGEVITYLEGTPGVLCDPEDGSSVSCTWNIPEGSAPIGIWAHSSYGDTSKQASIPRLVDETAPVHTTPFSPPNGLNGWHVSPVAISPGFAADALSGIAFSQYRVDGGDWQTGATTINTDGVYTLSLYSEDQAGNSFNSTATLQIDQTPPQITAQIPYADGLGGWFVGEVSLTAGGMDNLSGVSVSEVQVDGGEWVPDSASISEDGWHEVVFRVTDLAGNVETSLPVSLALDQTQPELTVDAPKEGAIVKGTVSLSGIAADALSGLKSVQIQIGNGELTNIPFEADGSWAYDWNTHLYPGGTHSVQVIATDTAGNEHIWQQDLFVANAAPRVEVDDAWYIWETGTAHVYAGDLPLDTVEIRIATAYGSYSEVFHPNQESWVHEIDWDRRIAGHLAPPGEYQVTVTAKDAILGRTAEASGIILIPAPPPTLIPSATLTSTTTPTIQPTETELLLEPTQVLPTLPLATSVPPEVMESPVREPEPIPDSPPWWAAWSLVGLLAVFAGTAITDPRPRALRRLKSTFAQISENLEHYGGDHV